jgi:pilus assembly protein Flp/PilA
VSSPPGIVDIKEILVTVRNFMADIRGSEEGQGLAEYALILALIAIIAIAALVFLGTQISTILSRVGASI